MFGCAVLQTTGLLVGEVELAPRLLKAHIHAFLLEGLWDRVEGYVTLVRFRTLEIIHFYYND